MLERQTKTKTGLNNKIYILQEVILPDWERCCFVYYRETNTESSKMRKQEYVQNEKQDKNLRREKSPNETKIIIRIWKNKGK